MKANELMIGDWVDTFPVYSQILSIGKKGKIWTTEQGNYKVEVAVAIPLNEEILKANGFTELPNTPEDCMDFVFSNEDGIRVYVTPEIGQKYGVHALFTGKIDTTIRYVHDLQHILRLIGLNDLADNFKI